MPIPNSFALWFRASFSIYKTAALVYFNCNNEVNDFLSRVEQAGGKIEKPKITIAPEIGYLCFH
jgi:predicted enzyme related to lactoylglutathione lyase